MVPMKLLALSIVLLLPGFVLLWIGRRGRRVGTELHCRKCEYILLAFQTLCPECGLDLNKRRPVVGEYRRRWLAYVVGTACICSAGIMLRFAVPRAASEIRLAKYYRYWPTACVMWDLGTVHQYQAAGELVHRIEAGLLSPAQAKRLADRVLRLLDGSAAGSAPDELIELSPVLLARDLMTDDQARHFLLLVQGKNKVTYNPDVTWLVVWTLTHNAGSTPYSGYFWRLIGHCRCTIVEADGQKMHRELSEQLLMGGCPQFNGKMPFSPVHEFRVRVETTWYFCQDESVYKNSYAHGWPGQQYTAKVLASKRLCTFANEVTLDAEHGWRCDVEPALAVVNAEVSAN